MNVGSNQGHAVHGPDPVILAALLMMAFIGVGILHVWWLKSRLSTRFRIPLDAGKTFRGRRLLGDNKTVNGFVVLVPAAGMAFLGLSLLKPILPAWWSEGVWPLSTGEYGLLGAWAGIGFMAGELPNSFLKRQCDIPPGASPSTLWLKLAFMIFDRVDSILGMLLALSLVVTVPPATWGYVLLFGPGLHFLFSASMYALRLKARAA
jgi:CDP-2,3-bis-(O-geranylgeranyl)-sn-glycerol synthase